MGGALRDPGSISVSTVEKNVTDHVTEWLHHMTLYNVYSNNV